VPNLRESACFWAWHSSKESAKKKGGYGSATGFYCGKGATGTGSGGPGYTFEDEFGRTSALGNFL
jgi:hypothetical protein